MVKTVVLSAVVATLVAVAQFAGGANPAEAILILGGRNSPPVIELVAALGSSSNLHPKRLSGITVDMRDVETGAEARAVVRALLNGDTKRYRAIFSPSQTFARAAQLERPDLPIVFDGVDDPVAICLVDSLRRPGRNATGYMHYLTDDEPKMLELLRDGFPSLKGVHFLLSGDNLGPLDCEPSDPVWATPKPPCLAGSREVDEYTRRRVRADLIAAHGVSLGLKVNFVVLCDSNDFKLLPQFFGPGGDFGIVVPWHSLFDEHAEQLADVIAKTRRPAVFPRHRFAHSGGLMSIEPTLDKEEASVLTMLRVLGGRSPAELPVQMPRGFSIVVNASSAVAQGITPSLMLLRRADEILK
jgi:putative ABC transport system substrate-binding protein